MPPVWTVYRLTPALLTLLILTLPSESREALVGTMIPNGHISAGGPSSNNASGHAFSPPQMTLREAKNPGTITPGVGTLEMILLEDRKLRMIPPGAKIPETNLLGTKASRIQAPRLAAQTGIRGLGVRREGSPDRLGTIIVLLLILVTLMIMLAGAWFRLRAYGDSGAYYPSRAERRSEEGNPGLSSTPSQMGWRDEEEGGGEEEDEEDEEEEEEEGRGDSEGQTPSLSEYSNLSGIDLQERMEGGEGDSNHSPLGSQALGELHSFGGTACWEDGAQDMTAL
ncbi:protein tyrosine phosphatase receptor type C-associated protein-like [Narcine bancroftii]|uniref:protein tyrosine phosphatase receptor type C-associated protein-like n=1 Tax=Narcine bancroftii TaxID=1343680 RepID=UPI0038321961